MFQKFYLCFKEISIKSNELKIVLLKDMKKYEKTTFDFIEFQVKKDQINFIIQKFITT